MINHRNLGLVSTEGLRISDGFEVLKLFCKESCGAPTEAVTNLIISYGSCNHNPYSANKEKCIRTDGSTSPGKYIFGEGSD